MPKCDICGEETDKLENCVDCSNLVCEMCYVNELCLYCFENQHDEEEES